MPDITSRFEITIVEIPIAKPSPEPGAPNTTGDLGLGTIERLRQTLDVLDVGAVIRLINAPPKRERKKRTDTAAKK